MGGGAKRGWRQRRLAVALSLGGVSTLLVGAGVVAIALAGGEQTDAVVTTPVALEPEEMYPSLAEKAPRAASYQELFERGQSLATAAGPACPRYRDVRRAWARRAAFLHESSLGAGASKRAAVSYYANVTWVSQDEAGDFENALARISRSRLSVATGYPVLREPLVASFTRDALALCGLDASHTRTQTKLARLDRRIVRIIELARFDSAGLSDGAAQ